MKTMEFNIFLIKNGFDLKNIIDDEDSYVEIFWDHSISNEDLNRSLLFKIRYQNFTRYVKYVRYDPTKKTNKIYNDTEKLTHILSNSLAINIVDIYELKINNSIIRFALKLGKSKILNMNSVVERFGLKTILNYSSSLENMKEVKTIDVSHDFKSVTQKHHVTKSLNSFEFKKYTNIWKNGKFYHNMYEILGLELQDSRKQTITCGNNLQFRIKINTDEIPQMLIKIFDIYKLQNYKNIVPWLDNIEIISDKELIENLNEEVVKKINEEDWGSVWMASPILDEYEFTKVSYDNKKIIETNDINIKEFLSFNENIKYWDDLKKIKINLYNDFDHRTSENSTKFIYSEIIHDDKTYILEDNNWYVINSSYKKEINDFYDNIPIWNEICLPNYLENNEGRYNANVGESNEFLCLDKKLVRLNNRDKFEIADLMHKDKILFHVKRYGNSCQIAHLFSQGRISYNEIWDNNSFNCINEIILEETNKQNKNNCFEIKQEDKTKIKIVFCIISKSENERPYVPFFAKTSIKVECENLKSNNAKFYIYKIKDES